jgi:hypothetical protein
MRAWIAGARSALPRHKLDVSLRASAPVGLQIACDIEQTLAVTQCI